MALVSPKGGDPDPRDQRRRRPIQAAEFLPQPPEPLQRGGHARRGAARDAQGLPDDRLPVPELMHVALQKILPAMGTRRHGPALYIVLDDGILNHPVGLDERGDDGHGDAAARRVAMEAPYPDARCVLPGDDQVAPAPAVRVGRPVTLAVWTCRRAFEFEVIIPRKVFLCAYGDVLHQLHAKEYGCFWSEWP